jgi:hypothetical protein
MLEDQEMGEGQGLRNERSGIVRFEIVQNDKIWNLKIYTRQGSQQQFQSKITTWSTLIFLKKSPRIGMKRRTVQ